MRAGMRLIGDGRCVVVTGANSGIGLACALSLARQGFGVVATVRSGPKADVVYGAAERADVAVEAEVLEVTDADACADLIERRRPWGLVNNAGINTVGSVEDSDDEQARAQFEINAIAPMRLARLAVPHMRAAGGGRIVNISSTEGRVVLPLLPWYQAAKHALEAAAGTLRIEVAGDGILVSCVEPGGVDTAIFQKGFWVDEDMYAGSRYRSAYERLKKLMDLNKAMQISADEVAAVVLAALTAERPRARYPVGADARALMLAHNLVPVPLRDRLHRRVFQL